jgi:putative endonuclease
VWFLYIVRCADDSLYIGETANVDRRIVAHNKGDCPHTSSRRPVTLACCEQYVDRRSCLERERQIKRWTRAKKEALIEGNIALLKKL